MSQWQYLGGHPATAPGSTVQVGPGGVGAGGTRLRDQLDARRMGVGGTPDAAYPDGYLGTIQSRREDRLLDSLKTRQNQRSYQRGVHKGERIDAADYFWPDEFNPGSGLLNQSRARQVGNTVNTPRQAPLMTVAEEMTAYGEILPARARDATTSVRVINPERRAQMKHLAPNWR